MKACSHASGSASLARQCTAHSERQAEVNAERVPSQRTVSGPTCAAAVCHFTTFSMFCRHAATCFNLHTTSLSSDTQNGEFCRLTYARWPVRRPTKTQTPTCSRWADGPAPRPVPPTPPPPQTARRQQQRQPFPLGRHSCRRPHLTARWRATFSERHGRGPGTTGTARRRRRPEAAVAAVAALHWERRTPQRAGQQVSYFCLENFQGPKILTQHLLLQRAAASPQRRVEKYAPSIRSQPLASGAAIWTHGGKACLAAMSPWM